MIYYKYTNGEAFTSPDGSPYIGFFHVNDSEEAFSGKVYDSDSISLIPNDTFISDFYLNKLEFDNTQGNLDNISYKSINYFDILNKNELDNILNSLNLNNLKVFKSFVTRNPEIVSFDRSNSHYYGLSSTEVDTKDNDTLTGKTAYSQIDPFSYSNEWGFLDDVRTGTLMVNGDEFRYVCSTGTDLIVLDGNLGESTPLKISRNDRLQEPEEIHQIYQDIDNDRLSILYNDSIVVYSASNFINCGVLLTIDIIKLESVDTDFIKWSIRKKFNSLKSTFNNRYINDNPNNPKYIKFGKNVRTGLLGNNLQIFNKYSNDLIHEINLKTVDIGDILNIAIRTIDDLIAISHKTENIYKISFIDPTNLLTTHSIIEGIDDDTSIYFSESDSNIIYTSSETKLESRYITNPKNHIGITNDRNLKYLRTYKFGSMEEKFGDTKIKWTSQPKKSNNYNNIVFDETSNLGKEIFLLHNVGRIYTLKHPIHKSLKSTIPLSTPKNYVGTSCSETSIGFDFNIKMLQIVKDILTLHNQARSSFVLGNQLEEDVINDLNYDIDNFFTQNNESFNTISIHRILNLINNLQNTLINPTSV